MIRYGQYCPVSRALEVLGQRWGLLVVRELLSGDLRFRDLQRSLPTCPPATLSKRLKELIASGVVEQREQDGVDRYGLTEAGRSLQGVLDELGQWGQRWARSSYGDDELDAESLLWDMRYAFDPARLGVDKAVVQLDVATATAPRSRRLWVVMDREAVDVCTVDPERPVDVVIEGDLRTLARVWMGELSFDDAARARAVRVIGPAPLAERVARWYPQHPLFTPSAAGDRSGPEVGGARLRR